MRVGVLGTLVRDVIRHPGNEAPVRAWGGIAYALAGFDAALPKGWQVVPIVRLGEDMADGGRAYLRSFDRVSRTEFVRIVPEPNNRVELVYDSPSERTEFLRGGVSGWPADEICAILQHVDALYVNFVSGRELDLAGARRIQSEFAGPSYADLHSLFLDFGADGRRTPRRLESPAEWAVCFDTVQMNHNEFKMFAAGESDPWGAVAGFARGRLRLVAVTEGASGATFLRVSSRAGRSETPVRVPVADGSQEGDPTGCGDVWGAAFFSGVLAGRPLPKAAAAAHALAAAKVASSGVQAFRAAIAARPQGLA